MKIDKLLFLGLLITFLTSCKSTNCINNPNKWSSEQISKWFDQKAWLGKTELQCGSSFDKNEFFILYHKNKARWDLAFDFLKHADLSSLTVGVHELDGLNAFVKVTEYNTQSPNRVLFEKHEKYADIHYVVSGSENIQLAALAGATLKKPYDAEKDISFYNATENQTFLGIPGTFFIILPNELHRPGMNVKESIGVKKIVVKIKV